MTDQEVPMEGLTVRLRFDADSVHGSVYNGDEYMMSTGYSFVRAAGSWAKAREVALKEAARKVAIIREFGPPPPNETLTLDELPEIEPDGD